MNDDAETVELWRPTGPKELALVEATGFTRWPPRLSEQPIFLDAYEIHQVGGETILEYWIPAEDLEELNDNIVGKIEVVESFR